MGKLLMRLFTGLHGRFVKLTGIGAGAKDGSVLVLEHTGAKSGKVRETPLMLLNHNQGYVVVASMGGAPENPAWYHNLMAHPETKVTVDRRTIPVVARELEGAERDQVWSRLQSLDRRWEQYQSKTDRRLPLIALEPR